MFLSAHCTRLLNPLGAVQIVREKSRCGPGACDKCKSGFTYNRVSNTCERCAAHCLKCDEVGPGGCNECGARRMLHARLDHCATAVDLDRTDLWRRHERLKESSDGPAAALLGLVFPESVVR